MFVRYSLLAFALAVAALCQAAESPVLLDETFDLSQSPALLSGDVSIKDFGKLEQETNGKCAALDSSGPQHRGAVSFRVTGLGGSEGQWFRFSFRGLPGKDFRVRDRDGLVMRARFLGQSGTEPLDGVVKEIYADIETDRKDIEVNGDLRRYGSSVWTTYAFEFRLPFNSIDTLDLSVAFENGEGKAPYGTFFVDEVKLEKIDRAVTAAVTPPRGPSALDIKRLILLGGHWYYLRGEGELSAPRHFDSTNFDRLAYRTGDVYEFPFAQNRGTWMRQGYKDAEGRIVQADQWLPNPVEVDFTDDTMILRSRNIPNHPTGKFPGYLGNPCYIQEQHVVVYLPLEPKPNAQAIAMTKNNSNYALQMGPTGIAVNGVVFYNPFDANMTEAVNMMDRCCGHPDPGNRYHYHKYPVCSRSPFEDGGASHSPLIGWAFDGFPVYGPYEGNGEMAMDSKTNPLNAFNVHFDEARGWHYHVSPGRFPYIIGGYWGTLDRRNLQRRPMR